MNYILYNKIWNYLFEYHKFKTNIIPSELDKSISQSSKDNNNINNNLIHIRCFFLHYSKGIKDKLQKMVFVIKI